MLSFASMATDMTEIPYELIKSTLKLDKDKDVELWVIKANLVHMCHMLSQFEEQCISYGHRLALIRIVLTCRTC